MNDLRYAQQPAPKTLFYRPNIAITTFGVDNSSHTGATLESCSRYGGTVLVSEYQLVCTYIVTCNLAVTHTIAEGK